MSFRRVVALVGVVVLVGGAALVARPAAAALLSPTLTSVTPSQIVPGVNNQTVTLHGDFTSGQSQVSFTPNTGITIVGSPTTSEDLTKITVKVNVAEDAPNTARDVTVTGGLLGSSSTCSKCITVGPAITSVTGPLANTSEAANFTITGQAFKAPVTVQISRSGYGFGAAETDTILATNVQVPNATTITATVNPFTRAPGRWKVSITQGNGGKASFGDGVTTGLLITGNKPTLASITPSRINSNANNQSFALTGAGFAQGMTATVSGSGVTQSDKIVLGTTNGRPDPTKATLKLTSTSSPSNGPQTLVLKNADGQSSTNAEAICVNCDLPAPGPPTVSTVFPSILGRGANQIQMTVTGTNFGAPVPTATVSPNGTGDNAISIAVTRDSATQLTLTVSVGSTAPAGARDLTIQNPNGGGSVTKDNAFSVSTDFNVTHLTPPGRPQGFSGPIVINGSGFSGTPSAVTFSPGNDITVGTITRDSPAKITVNIAVGGAAATAPRDVSVTIGGVTKVCDDCFKVGLVPTVTSISPTAATGGGPAAISSLNGTNFAPGAGATLERSGQPSIAMTDVVVESASKITGTFDLTNAAPGMWSVRVTNADGGTAVLNNGFEVTLGPPSVNSVDPESITQGTSGTFKVLGASFAPGVTLSFPNADGLTITETTRKSNSETEIQVTAAEGARLGSRDVKATNTDGQSDICESCLVVVQGTQAKLFGPGVTAYENFNGGAYVGAGNIDGVPTNGTEFVTAPNAGGGPHVRPYRVNPANGNIQELGTGFMAYTPQFTGGVRVAVGNIDGNPANGEEIITGAGPGGGPHVRIFRLNNDLTVTEPFGTGFFAYGPEFHGGVWVAAVDVNGDGRDEIVTGPGAGGGPHVRVFRVDLNGTISEMAGFMAYDPAFGGGVVVGGGNLVAEDVDNPALGEIVTAPSFGGGPHVRIFGGTGQVKREFMAFSSEDSRGYRVTVGDFNFDTIEDIAVGRGTGTDIYVAQITDPPKHHESLATPNPRPLGDALTVGTNIAAADVDGDGDKDIIVSPDHDSAVTIRLLRPVQN